MHRIAVIALALIAACGGPRRQTDFESGTQVHTGEKLQVEVTRVKVDGHKLEVRMTFTNLNDGPFAFKRNTVSLAYGEKKIAPREAWGGGERDVDFAVKGQQKRKAYIFECEPKGTDVAAGDYTVALGGVMNSGGLTALSFTIKVP